MSEPIYSDWFEAMWNTHIPELFRAADADESWQLKRWFAGIGEQYSQLNTLAERFLYIAPNDRNLRHEPPMTTGEQITSIEDEISIDPPLPAGPWTVQTGSTDDPWGGLDTTLSYRHLDDFADGAYVEWDHYVSAGTWRFQFVYPKATDNGKVTVSIDGTDVQTVDLATGTWTSADPVAQSDEAYSYPYEFTVERGWVSIKLRFDTDVQDDNTKRMSIGPMFMTNVSLGYQYGTSDLVNPRSADAAWLPWLSQLFGVNLDQSKSVSDQRNQILTSYKGFLAGTKTSIAESIKPFLARTRTVHVFDHSTVSGIGTGGQWDVLVVTRASETPVGLDVVATITASGAKPAGVVIHHMTYEASWSVLETDRPTWSDWEPDDWTSIEETGLA